MKQQYERLIELSLEIAHEHYQKMVRYQRVGNHHKAEWHRAQIKLHATQAWLYKVRMTEEWDG